MVRSLFLSIALMFSFLTVAGADLLPRPERQPQERCACVRAPCNCERYERDLDRQKNKATAFSHCTGANHQLAQVGTREVCTYTDVSCLKAKSDTPREYTEVTINAYCAKPSNGECPRPRDLTDCVNSDDVSASDVRKIAEALTKKTCDSDSSPSPSSTTRPAAPARRNQ